MKQQTSSSLQDLIEALISPDYRANRDASHTLAALGDEAVVALERALQQVQVENQKMLIYFTLKNIRSTAATSALLSLFSKESNEFYRSFIADGLGLAQCLEAGPILEQDLGNTQDQKLIWSIRVALAHLGERDEQYRSYLFWLIEQADDSNESRRIEAVRTLKTFETEAATSKLLEKLQYDRVSYVKALAALSLTEHNLNHIQKPLETIVETGDPEASLFASLILSHLRQVPLHISVKKLGKRIRNWPFEGRMAAIMALSWFYPQENGVEVLSVLIDFLATDNNLTVKQAVVRAIDRFKAISMSVDTAEAITILQEMTSEKQKNEVSILATVALVKLGHRQYLDVVREYLIEPNKPDQALAHFILGQIDAELSNDIIPFLLDLVDHVDLKTRIVVESLLHHKYWRDTRLIPYFRECLAGKHKTNMFLLTEFLRILSKQGYKPVYHLLKDFLGEEP